MNITDSRCWVQCFTQQRESWSSLFGTGCKCVVGRWMLLPDLMTKALLCNSWGSFQKLSNHSSSVFIRRNLIAVLISQIVNQRISSLLLANTTSAARPARTTSTSSRLFRDTFLPPFSPQISNFFPPQQAGCTYNDGAAAIERCADTTIDNNIIMAHGVWRGQP